MKTVMKIVLGIVIASVLLIGGCFALVGGVANEVDKELKKDKESSTTGKQSGGSSGDEASSAPDVVGNWNIENMKQVKFTEDEFGGSFASIPLKVRNVSDSSDSPWFEIRLTDKRGDLVAEFDCIGDEYEPGQGGTVDCSTMDDFAPFKDWELKDAF